MTSTDRRRADGASIGPPPLIVPYGQGAARGMGPDELGVHGVQMDQLVALGLPTVPGVTLPAGDAAELTDPVTARRAVELVEAMSERRLGDDERPMLLRLLASTSAEASGLPPDVSALGLTMARAERFVAVNGRAGDLFVAWSATVRAVAEGALDCPADDVDDILVDIAEPKAQVEALIELCAAKGSGPFPDDPAEQLALAAASMLARWSSPRAQRARRGQGLPADAPLVLHVQALRIGPWEKSGFGIAQSRNSGTGLAQPHGTFYRGVRRSAVASAAGEPLSALPRPAAILLRQALTTLEHNRRAVAEVTFELRDDQLALLSATEAPRPGPLAAVRLAVDLARGDALTREEAVRSVAPSVVQDLLHAQLALTGQETLFVTGLAASPGAASGQVVLSSDRALDLAQQGIPVVLVAAETTPADVPALLAAEAVLTANGGLASHAAVVARGAGRPAVCGASDLGLDVGAGAVAAPQVTVREGDLLTVDGSTGRVYIGAVPVRTADPPPELKELLSWADDCRRMKVRTNADTASEAATAIRYGAEGIGLCRTEHQFFGDRLPLIRRLILAWDKADELQALAALAEAQREDFRSLLAAVGDRPVTVRLLDAPLHEFIPHDGEYESVEQARSAGAMRESNSMLGLRGVRLAVLREGLYPAQVEALVRAWADVTSNGLLAPALEIMVPLVAIPEELALVFVQIRDTVARLEAELGIEVPYLLGSMIETPRAALLAAEFAAMCDFLSFGTNDLTQLTYGFSRDDVEKHVLGAYVERGLLTASPFLELDRAGVGRLLAEAVAAARAARPGIKLGVCGEHGGDPSSISFFESVGLDYVSCSPLRVPVARLAAAQARDS